MSATKITGFEKAFAEKGKVLNKEQQLFELSKQQFELKQEVTILWNKIYKLTTQKTDLKSKITQIEKMKDKLFIAMGLKFVEEVKGDE